MIAYCASFKVSGDSGFGVVLCTDDEKIIFSIPIEKPDRYTTNQLALLAIKYALQANKNKSSMKIDCSNKYATDMLGKTVDGSWKKNPRLNIDLVNKIRRIIDDFKTLSINYNKDHELEDEIKSTTDEW